MAGWGPVGTHYELSQKVIPATAVLFNLARKWENEFNEEGSDDEGHDATDDSIVEDLAPATIRMRRQIFSDQLKDAMPNCCSKCDIFQPDNFYSKMLIGTMVQYIY